MRRTAALPLLGALALAACASAELRPEATEAMLQPQVVAADPDEVVGAIEAVVRDDPDWRIEKLQPEQGTAWLVHYTQRLRFADDVVIRVYPLDAGRSVIRGWSRSRIGLNDFGQNARNLADLMGRLTEYFQAREIAIDPVADEAGIPRIPAP